MYTVYAIARIHRKYVYVGLTTNLEARLIRHNKGLEVTTKPYAPFILVFTEAAIDRAEARAKEKFFKSRSGKRIIYHTIQKNFNSLSQYQ